MLINNLEHKNVMNLRNKIEYEENSVVSLTLAKKKGVGMTLFAFWKGEGIQTHQAPGDAFVYILEGSVEITIDKDKYYLKENESIIMPCGIPHALKALENFKMLLVVVKED